MELEELKAWLDYSKELRDIRQEDHGHKHSSGRRTYSFAELMAGRHLWQWEHAAQIELFTNYLETMELFLDEEMDMYNKSFEDTKESLQKELNKQNEQINELKEQLKAGLISDGDYRWARNDVTMMFDPNQYYGEVEQSYGELSMMVAGFADTLRNSFFTILYGFWESQLAQMCNSLKNYDDTMLFDNTIEFKPEHAKPLLRKIGFPLGARVWCGIKEYGTFRNCIVHHNGQIDKTKEGSIKMKELIRKQSLISLDKNKIILNDGFCEEALDTIKKYFDELLETLAKWDSEQRAS